MTLRIIRGRAGSGKTHLIIEEILGAEDPWGKPLILLAPEQATFQYEKLLLEKRPGLMRIQVLSFRRLAWQILQRTGGATRQHIGELGKQMILRRLLYQHQKQLTVFARSSKQKNFSQTLAKAIGELKIYEIKAPVLQEASQQLAEQGQQILSQKLADLALLYQGLNEALQEQYLDPDDYLSLLAEQIPHSDFLEGAEIWVDGFKGFTQQEFHVLEALLAKVKRVSVSLCLDPLAEEPVFYSVEQTAAFLQKMAAPQKAEKLILDPPLKPRFQLSPVLAYLEAHYFSLPAPAFSSDSALKEQLEVSAATSLTAEVEGAVRKILALVRDRGWRWREITVLVRDLAPYENLIANLFSEACIPYFLDQKQKVLYHPLVELLRSALEAAQKNWTYEPVFRYLKTGFIALGREQVDLLENLVLAKGIRGKKWLDSWDFPELPEADSWRIQAISELEKFIFKLQQPELTFQIIIEALYQLLLDLEVPAKLKQWQEAAKTDRLWQEASEHEQIWDLLMGLWEEMGQALGAEKVDLAEFTAILNSGLESLNLGFIPPTLDQVIVGVLDRSRSPEVKAALILGVGEGVLPAKIAESGVFSSWEREQLAQIGVNIAPGTRYRVWEEQFLVYQALTRSSHYLYLSYPLSDSQGQAAFPSPLIHRLTELFPALKPKMLRDDPQGSEAEQIEYIAYPSRCLSYLGGKLKQLEKGIEPEPLWQSVYLWLQNSSHWAKPLRQLEKGLFFSNQIPDLKSHLTKAYYKLRLRTSVTKLEKYAACPFSHFLNYTLNLQERKIYRFKAPEIGSFFHAALQKYLELVPKDKLGVISETEIQALISQILAELALEQIFTSFQQRGLIRRLERQLVRTALIMREHFRRGEFWPDALEINFDKRDFQDWNLALGQKLELFGRIDRVDLAEKDGRSFIRVLDYKSSRQNWQLNLYAQGLDLQLPLYLKMGQEIYQKKMGQKLEPAGMFYLTVEDPLLLASGAWSPEEREQEILKAHRLKGLVLRDETVIKMMDREIDKYSLIIPAGLGEKGVYQKPLTLSEAEFRAVLDSVPRIIGQLSQAIGAGKIPIRPYRIKTNKACTFCLYHSICQFDPAFSCNQYKILPNLDDQQILAEMLKGAENELD